jgi:FRG domain
MSGPRTIPIRSLSEFQQLINGDDFKGWAFRGQEDAAWPLESTIGRIFRNFKVHPEMWVEQEMRVNRVFKRKAHLFLEHVPPEDDDFQWLALMQHHGAPTRLLDFTWSPYVAAFFALEKAKSAAAIWAICPPRVWEQVHTQPNTGDRVPTSELFLGKPGRYSKWYLTEAFPFIVYGEPLVMNQRLVAQSGTFIVPGVIDRSVESIVEEYPHPEKILAKLVIDSSVRDDFMSALYNMNVTNATLFPGLDGMARSLNYELEFHWEKNPKTLELTPAFRPDALT